MWTGEGQLIVSLLIADAGLVGTWIQIVHSLQELSSLKPENRHQAPAYELLSNLVYGLGRVPVRLFHYLFTILELNIVDHKGQQIKSTNPLLALLRGF